MIGSQRVIALIPARGGSKGIPRKNLAPLGGHPLLAWSIECARRAGCIDRVIVSTEDEEIAATARRYGAELAPRDAALATDTAGVFEVAQEFTSRWAEQGESAKTLVVLEPTAPFRSPQLVADCAAAVARGRADSAASFRPCHTHPHRAWRLEGAEPTSYLPDARPWARRQDLPEAWEISGEVYAFNPAFLDPADRAFLVGRVEAVRATQGEHVDIDRPVDLTVARAVFPETPLAGWTMTPA